MVDVSTLVPGRRSPRSTFLSIASIYLSLSLASSSAFPSTRLNDLDVLEVCTIWMCVGFSEYLAIRCIRKLSRAVSSCSSCTSRSSTSTDLSHCSMAARFSSDQLPNITADQPPCLSALVFPGGAPPWLPTAFTLPLGAPGPACFLVATFSVATFFFRLQLLVATCSAFQYRLAQLLTVFTDTSSFSAISLYFRPFL